MSGKSRTARLLGRAMRRKSLGWMFHRAPGTPRVIEWRELDETEGRAAGEAFSAAHPIYSRVILRVLARLNRFGGDPYEAVVQNLPMLGLRRVGS